MTLYEKIKSIYPQLVENDFVGKKATITLQNDSDGKGDYIAFWNHPIYPKPTDAQLAEIN
jgi:hypothetical protein